MAAISYSAMNGTNNMVGQLLPPPPVPMQAQNNTFDAQPPAKKLKAEGDFKAKSTSDPIS